MDWWQVAGQLLLAGAIYGGIRADLKHVKESADAAHERIDAMLLQTIRGKHG